MANSLLDRILQTLRPRTTPAASTSFSVSERVRFAERQQPFPGSFETGELPLVLGTSPDGKVAAVVHLDRHPTRPLWAIELLAEGHGETYAAGVWHAETGKLLFAKPGGWATRWAADGSSFWVAGSTYQHAPEAHEGRPRVVTPLQCEFAYHLEQVDLETGRVLKRLDFGFPTGWPTRLFVNRTRTLAAAVFNEQDAGGYVLLQLDEAKGVADAGVAVSTAQGSFFGPIESEDGQYLISAVPQANELGEVDAETLSEFEDEELEVAAVFVQHLPTKGVHRGSVKPESLAFYRKLADDPFEEGQLEKLELKSDMLQLTTAAGSVHLVLRSALFAQQDPGDS